MSIKGSEWHWFSGSENAYHTIDVNFSTCLRRRRGRLAWHDRRGHAVRGHQAFPTPSGIRG